MLSPTVEFNWDTDGINFGVLTLIVLLTMHQRSSSFFLQQLLGDVGQQP